ncbi:MAG TPA: TetR/AcrR family transcriptional regulator [Mycobacteriales bacterium]|jgi:AcrR family transcriptional regulator|nr:TetR/AcrR family transcriptional regulator [Mycobacteriales bacterium]
MVKEQATKPDWREARRRAARDAIVAAAWALVERDGLAALSLRDLAQEAGITTPTVYAYFDSKNAIYDAMFGQAAEQFGAHMAAVVASGDVRADLIAATHRFAEYCIANPARYQLLFQRTIPDFEPSEASYAHAVAALGRARVRLVDAGIADPRHLDLWTALTTGLVDQQISNDPNGDRWLRLIEDAVDMFLAHCRPASAPTSRRERVRR